MRLCLSRAAVLAALLCSSLTPGAVAQDAWSAWRVLGPFAFSWDAQAANELPFAGELAQLAPGGPGPDMKRAHECLVGPAVWAPLVGAELVTSVALDVGRIDLTQALAAGAERAPSRVFLYRSFEASEAVELPLVFGSDDGLRVWWNGELVVDQRVKRGLALGDGRYGAGVSPGSNHLLVEISQDGGAWGFQMAGPVEVDATSVDAAIERGVRWLMDQQLIDGSWGHYGGPGGYGGGHPAYTAYVMMKMGLAPSNPAVRRALAYASEYPTAHTYAAACEILALAERGKLRTKDEQAWLLRRVDDLVDWQTSTGQWNYPVHPSQASIAEPDLSNTLYAALALHAAAKAGARIPDKVWKELFSGTLRCLGREQDVLLPRDAAELEDPEPVVARGFSYRPGGGVTGSMTTAGVGILALVEGHTKLAKKHRSEWEEVRQDALRWLAVNLDYSKNPGQDGHHYFFIYGVERVGSLLAVEQIGGVDWYEEGARYLLGAQQDDGSWGSEPAVDTLLALLFLERASRPTSGSSAKLGPRNWETTDQQAQIHLRAQGDTPFTVYLHGFSRAAREEYVWSGESGRGLHVERVEYFARRLASSAQPILIGSVDGDPEHPAGPERFAARCSFPGNGTWIVTCRATIAKRPTPTGESGGRATLNSAELAVEIRDVFDESSLRYPSDARRNQWDEVKVDASSALDDMRLPAKVLDGQYTTSWLSAVDDPEPWIRLRLARQRRGGLLLLSPSSPRPTHAALPRPSRVALRLDEGDERVIELSSDPLLKTEIDLGKVKFRDLSLRLIESPGRVVGTQAIGFSEIQLLTP